MKRLALTLLLVLPAMAEWPRMIITPRHSRVDTPKAFPLAYFTELPELRDEDNNFCYLCSPEKRLEEAKKSKLKAEVRFIGKFGAYSAFDVFYTDPAFPTPVWKSILIQTGPDLYQEIYHDQPNEGEVEPSFVVASGTERYLCVLDNVYRWDSAEHCFWLERKGVVKVNFGPIWDEAEKAAPKDRKIWAGEINAPRAFAAGKITVGFRTSRNRCCEEGTGVSVWFKLKRGIVTVTRTQVLPGASGK